MHGKHEPKTRKMSRGKIVCPTFFLFFTYFFQTWCDLLPPQEYHIYLDIASRRERSAQSRNRGYLTSSFIKIWYIRGSFNMPCLNGTRLTKKMTKIYVRKEERKFDLVHFRICVHKNHEKFYMEDDFHRICFSMRSKIRSEDSWRPKSVRYIKFQNCCECCWKKCNITLIISAELEIFIN